MLFVSLFVVCCWVSVNLLLSGQAAAFGVVLVHVRDVGAHKLRVVSQFISSRVTCTPNHAHTLLPASVSKQP